MPASSNGLADFIHLRVHCAYSLSEGAIRIKDLVGRCVAEKMPAVAITDTGNLFGALEFSQTAAEKGIQPIIGAQIFIRRDDEDRGGLGRDDLRKPDPDFIELLCQNELGYRNLCALVSKAYLETDAGERPQITFADVIAHAEGLIALTGGAKGALGRLLVEGQAHRGEELLHGLMQAFPNRLYVELQRHGMADEKQVEAAMIALADKLKLPLVATNEPYFLDEAMYEAHDALLCIADGAYVSQEERRRLTPDHRFKSAAEMKTLFADLPDAIENTVVIAKRCAFMVEKRSPILPAFSTEGVDEQDMLRKMAADGLERRLEILFPKSMDAEIREAKTKPYRERLTYELDMIVRMGFSGYFLIVADFIQWSKAQGIPVGPGRGSGAGSAVAWALTITDLDPLRFGLLFERFLNPERVSMPDFDIDFCMDRRDEVIRYVQNRYGADRVAQIITFGKLQARAVLRDVGRVLQMPYGQVDRLTKLVPNNPANPVTLPDAIAGEPLLQEMRDSDEQVAHLIDLAIKLEGLYRHASTHAAGVVIGDRPLQQLVPLYRDPRSTMPATQFNMKWVESAGLVKFDFLGLKTLTVLRYAVDFIKDTQGATIDLANIPLDDPSTFAMLGRGETIGVFQLEGSGMRDVMRGMRADKFEDLIAVVALYRPGPMDNIPRYISVKHGKEEADYLHPRLEKILKETNGIMIYQEQVMQIAQELSGYSLGGADLLRRAMGKKIQAEMDAQRKTFTDGAVGRGVDPAKATEIFDQVAKFAGYGFNKSHAAAYALVAYQTGWLKANFPVAFIAASMTCDLGLTDKLGVFKGELERMGYKILPPDINKSGADFRVEEGPDGRLAVRYALAALKGVGAAAMRDLVAERDKNGPFKSIADFAQRLDNKMVNRRQLESLVKAGAFDSVDNNRAMLFGGIDVILGQASESANERKSGQSNLFGGGEPQPLAMHTRLDWKPTERLQQEFEAVGFYLSAHPMEVYSRALQRLGVVGAANLQRHLAAGGNTRVKLAGVVTGKQERMTSRGTRMAHLTISDASGQMEITMFAEVLGMARELLEATAPILLTVEAQKRDEDESWRFTAIAVESLDKAAAGSTAGLRISINDDKPLPALKEIIGGPGKGKGGHIILVARAGEREVEAHLPGSYTLSPSLINAVRATPGVLEVREV
ncbi:MAG TPA: DNA polymerase III subunit alpha [Magnetospirillaceae bacterium]|jgi:DNA polymerase-3 subunit alpha